MEERQANALEFLQKIAGPPAEAVLESLEQPKLPDVLQGILGKHGEENGLVERTIDKISRNRSLDADESFALEAIIIPDRRPVLDVLEGNRFTTDHALWQDLLTGAPKRNLTGALPSVGRIELPGHPSLPYGGTGFVVGDGVMMTNRHVAEIFANGLGNRDLVFRPGLAAEIDLERRVDGGSVRCRVTRVLMIHPYWDMALLAIEGLPETARPLALATAGQEGPSRIAVIGYPAFDPRNDAGVQDRVFRGIYNVKRIMPGMLTGSIEVPSFGKTVRASAHDSSTLGGASGSMVFDLETGQVVALHFGGAYLKTNYGVPAPQLALDRRVIDAGVNFAGTPSGGPAPWEAFWTELDRPGREANNPGGGAPSVPPRQGIVRQGGKTSIIVPLKITVEIDDGLVAPEARAPTRRIEARPPLIATEAPATDYRNRKGYRPDFLSEIVPLPTVIGRPDDVLTFDYDGRREQELRYEHFSVVMSRSRRLCFFSAVNIDGKSSRKSRRVGWRTDSRLTANQQILNECYGNPPRFSRGHMTRREDPVWGDDAETANRGNADSMHVTNTVPQMQAFNSPIWLGLEDYALQHARDDDMRISVFTGPYFRDDDPVMDGVAIPVAFWKIIAFIHDERRVLCATGYEMDQSANLPRPGTEFVFGDYVAPQTSRSTQTSIRSIELRSGMSFGALAAADPLAGEHEAIAGEGAFELEQLEQIRFV
jgi:endonuclease G